MLPETLMSQQEIFWQQVQSANKQQRRYLIYLNNSLMARVNALQEIYPVCRQLVGEQCFERMAITYAKKTPSTHTDLNHYADDFADDLQQHCQQPGFEKLPFLPELARLEYLMHTIYYAADETTLDVDDFITSINRMGFNKINCIVLKRSVGFVRINGNVHDIWLQHQSGEPISVIHVEYGDYPILIYRDGFDIRLHHLPDNYTNVLEYFIQPVVIENLLHAVSQQSESKTLSADIVMDCIARGWLTLREHG